MVHQPKSFFLVRHYKIRQNSKYTLNFIENADGHRFESDRKVQWKTSNEKIIMESLLL